MSDFIQYSDILLDGFSSNSKSLEVVEKKRDLITEVLDHYDLDSSSILFVGFSPWCMAHDQGKFTITEVSGKVLDFLSQNDCKYEHETLANLVKGNRKFSVIVAADEYFTFSDSDQGQRTLVEQLAKLAEDVIITTLRDYKNQDFKNREFSQPIQIRGTVDKIFLEHYDYDLRDKNASTSRTYVLSGNDCRVHGPFARRNMYFKQLAKFSIDAGATNFFVHKNLMYKSVIKKNYEHVITIKF
jgi:hypothetical protein